MGYWDMGRGSLTWGWVSEEGVAGRPQKRQGVGYMLLEYSGWSPTDCKKYNAGILKVSE